MSSLPELLALLGGASAARREAVRYLDVSSADRDDAAAPSARFAVTLPAARQVLAPRGLFLKSAVVRTGAAGTVTVSAENNAFSFGAGTYAVAAGTYTYAALCAAMQALTAPLYPLSTVAYDGGAHTVTVTTGADPAVVLSFAAANSVGPTIGFSRASQGLNTTWTGAATAQTLAAQPYLYICVDGAQPPDGDLAPVASAYAFGVVARVPTAGQLGATVMVEPPNTDALVTPLSQTIGQTLAVSVRQRDGAVAVLGAGELSLVLGCLYEM